LRLNLFFLFIYFIFACSGSFGYVLHTDADSVYLILDEPYSDSLPRNFRRSDGDLRRDHKETPDTSGLSRLNISGSAEFSDKSLPLIKNATGDKRLIDIDLRQETHGFVNGMPISWYGKYDWANVGLTRSQVIDGEKKRLDSLKNTKDITILRIQKKYKANDSIESYTDISGEVKTSVTEEELVKSFGADYFRLTVSDHRQPLVEDVDRFINYITSLSGDHWIHFHCHAGDGRTTTFMVMYDMMKNAKNVSFEDILGRQYLLGGIDLTKDDDFPAYDKKYAIDRTEYLKKFYEYCRSNTDNFKTSYSDWIKK
jgi:hypothetical protein